MSTDREQLLGNASTPVQPYGATAENTLAEQRQTIRTQDHQLDQLSVGVTSVRNIADLIHTEVNSQNVVIDGLNTAVSDANRDIAKTGAKVTSLAGSSYNFRTFCMLLWPLVLLIVLLVEAIVHFIF